MTGVYETPAGMVRTGQVIKVATDGYRTGLEVEYVHHATTTLPDGTRQPAVWFTGWTAGGVRVERGWGQKPETAVLVTEDKRGHCYGTAGTADATDLAYLLNLAGGRP